MIVIDANSGRLMEPGSPIQNLDGLIRLESVVRLGLFRARLTVRELDAGEIMELVVPVRYFHPSFMFRSVAFWPS